MRTWFRACKTEFKLFFMIWLVYAVFSTPAGGVTPNRYVDLVHAMVNEGRFSIDTYHENTIDKAYFNGHFYAGALPGPAFVSVPSYLVFKGIYALMPDFLKSSASGIQSYKAETMKETSFYGQVDNVEFFLSQWFLNITVLAPVSALGSVLLFLSLRRLNIQKALALRTVFFYAFGTIIFFYSTTFFEQVFSSTVAIAGFFFALKAVQAENYPEHWKAAFLAGLLVGLGVLIEYTTIFFSFWIGMWILIRFKLKPAIVFGIGFAVPVMILMAYQYSIFDHPLHSPYMYLVEEHHKVHGEGFFGATYPRLDRLYELTLGPERGLVWFMPITVFGMAGLFIAYRKNKQDHLMLMICGLIILTYLGFYSSYTNWRGGTAFGPRYLTPALPFMFLCLPYVYPFIHRYLLDGLGILSIFINWLGAQFGFADSAWQHVQTLLLNGPTLAGFGAILSHTVDTTSTLYIVVSRIYAPITLITTLTLVALIFYTWRSDLFALEGKTA